MRQLAKNYYEIYHKDSKVIYLPEVESTSDYLKSHKVDHGTLVLTDFQSNGKGRRDQRTWTSEPGLSFTGSWSFTRSDAPSPVLPALVGLTIVELCSQFFPQMNWSLKAPNDILLSGKKCAGVLIELINQGFQTQVILGLGFNVFSSPENAIHLLRRESDSPSLFFEMISQLSRELEALVSRERTLGLSPEEQTRLVSWLNLNDNLVEKIEGISSEGDLLFKTKKISWMEL